MTIISSVFVIGFLLIIDQKLKIFTERQNQLILINRFHYIRNKSNQKLDFGNIFLKIIGTLLNQGFKDRTKFYLNIWSLMTIVLIPCYSASILSSLLFQPMKTINTFEELVVSNLSLVTGNYSALYYLHQWPGNDPKLLYIHKKISCVDDENV